MTESQLPTDPQPTEVEAPNGEASTQLAELRARVAELEDQWRRALADLDNLRKRTARDTQRALDEDRTRLTAQWLPVVDNLELALQHADADPAAIVPGVQAVLSLAVDLLQRLGYPRQDDIGKSFDPTHHEAVSTQPTADVPEGTVVHVVRPGYGDDQRQLRPASVVVASRPN
ncbi:MAG: nucleotide exchange factor GrpE [Frankiaceae bacterium]|nr:nucleotide exchange factor GrpE [Frankiaceae bacterium]MBV9872803.1 nucleotide exchange factor GrpE [Frankiaceae bacterium]